MKKELESKVQRKCQALVKENGGFVFKTHGDIYSRPGIPDLICCIPTSPMPSFAIPGGISRRSWCSM